MFTAYFKYISLLLISGLILTFYRATLPAIHIGLKSLNAVSIIKAGEKHHFSLLNDVILPFFPVLNKGELLSGNKK
ncbi:hypothetical protein ACFQZS_12150 [Mucilaginibacter calamicampi]|uniref:Uncharacterized protein n=1 Tax=Mucilaginibacter calamicampi TaxID=1302352 RepID=A0ABW2YYI5_9SPHI